MGRESFEDMKLPPLRKKVAPLSVGQISRESTQGTSNQITRKIPAIEVEDPTTGEIVEKGILDDRQNQAETSFDTDDATDQNETASRDSERFFTRKSISGQERNETYDEDSSSTSGTDGIQSEAVRDSSKFFDDFMQQDENRGRKYAIWGIVFASIIVLGIAAMTFWGGATVAVVARREAHPLTTTITAANKSSGASATALATSIPFQRISITKEAGKKIDATGEEYVERKASGKIVVYNNFSTASQRLIKNTRFESPEGKIYRIRDSIVIPGKKGTLPGSVEVTVYADEAGTSYNIGLTEFTIPGFKTDAGRFKNIYGRSKSAMVGGAKGMMKIVDPAQLEAVQNALTTELTEQIFKEAEAQTPAAFVFFRNSFPPVFEPVSQEAGTDQSVLIKQKAYLDAIIFNKEILAKALAGQILDNYDGSGISIDNWGTIVGKINNKDRNRISDTDVITLSLSGDATFVAAYDIQKIIDFLKGQNQTRVKELLTEFPQLESAKAVIRPFWKSTFPEDPSKIRVYEDIPASTKGVSPADMEMKSQTLPTNEGASSNSNTEDPDFESSTTPQSNSKNEDSTDETTA